MVLWMSEWIRKQVKELGHMKFARPWHKTGEGQNKTKEKSAAAT